MLFAFGSTLAQNKQAAIWHVGNKKLDFNTSPITVTEVASPFLGTRSSIALADSLGLPLLFASTQTDKLYNKNGIELINGNLNIGHPLQGNVLFVPKPEMPNYVYCIALDTHSLINLNLNSVVKQDTFLTNINAYSTHHSNCTDVWLILEQTQGFYSYLVSSSGISSAIDSVQVNINSHHRGCFSPSGKYLVKPIIQGAMPNRMVQIEFVEFDSFSGGFTKMYSYTYTGHEVCFASVFSPNSSMLYLFMQRKNSSVYDLCQVSVQNGIPDFENTSIIYTQTISGFSAFSSMQIGINGKMYQTFYFSASKQINIIHEPNLSGAACNYEDGAIILSTVTNSLPVFISTWLADDFCSPEFFVENICFNETTSFTLNNYSNLQSVLWHFGDSQTSTALEPTHIYTNAGTYTVTLTVTYTDGSTETITKEIEVYPKPLKPTIWHD